MQKLETKIILNILFILFCVIILALSLRGIYGNPKEETINDNVWTEEGPFELSPERGRFALTYSLAEDKSVSFSPTLAKFALPDLGYKDGKYVSLFAPGVSFIAIPGYLLGRLFGVSQVGVYLTISVFALLNAILIRLISKLLGAKDFPSIVASVIYLFATPAFSYAVSLYQHQISVFLILLSLYAVLRSRSFRSLAAVIFLCGLAISVDYPNVFLGAPVAIYALVKTIFAKSKLSSEITLRAGRLLALLAIIPPMIFFFWFNRASYGSPFQLAGTVEDVYEIDADGSPILFSEKIENSLETTARLISKEKTALGFFDTRNMIKGFYVLLISPDRGVIFYAPIVLLGVLGFSSLRKKHPDEFSLLISIVGVNLILYSMWGDPWGGWAFGSRYLIPSYAIMSIFISLAITKFRYNRIFLVFLYIYMLYSFSVNTLGAVTSSSNPPKEEAANLQLASGHIEKYTFERNFDLLHKNRSKSLMYREFASKYLSLWEYYTLISAVFVSASLASIAYLYLYPKDISDRKKL